MQGISHGNLALPFYDLPFILAGRRSRPNAFSNFSRDRILQSKLELVINWLIVIHPFELPQGKLAVAKWGLLVDEIFFKEPPKGRIVTFFKG